MNKIVEEVERFLSEPFQEELWKSEWLSGDGIKLYLRTGTRLFGQPQKTPENTGPPLKVPMVDVANIIIPRVTWRGKGRFKRLLPEIERLAVKYGFGGVYVESVIEPRLEEFFEKREDYERVWNFYPPSFYKHLMEHS